MFETLYESKQQRSETIKQVSSRRITNLRPSTSYLAQNDEERQTNILDIHQSTPHRPKDKTYRSPTPYPVHSSPPTHLNTSKKKISTKPKPTSQSHQSNIQTKSTDSFIDLLEEGNETAFSFNEDNLSMAQLLQWEFETRNLPAIELVRLDNNPCKCPDYIQNFKSCVHDKRSFNDSIRMERLISVLDGKAKRLVTSVGQSGIFYASALKTLKRNFGNPVVVSYMKLKTVLDLPHLPPNHYNGLRAYYQTLKAAITCWFPWDTTQQSNQQRVSRKQ